MYQQGGTNERHEQGERMNETQNFVQTDAQTDRQTNRGTYIEPRAKKQIKNLQTSEVQKTG